MLVTAQCAAGLWQEALHTLTQMRDDGVAPAASSYQPLLLLCERRVQWQLALQVRACESMRSSASSAFVFLGGSCRSAGGRPEVGFQSQGQDHDRIRRGVDSGNPGDPLLCLTTPQTD